MVFWINLFGCVVCSFKMPKYLIHWAKNIDFDEPLIWCGVIKLTRCVDFYMYLCVRVRFCGSRWSKFEINIDRTFTHATIINKLKNPQQKKIYEMEPLFWRSVPKINQKIQFIQFDLKCTWILCRTPFLHNEIGFAVGFANVMKKHRIATYWTIQNSKSFPIYMIHSGWMYCTHFAAVFRPQLNQFTFIKLDLQQPKNEQRIKK